MKHKKSIKKENKLNQEQTNIDPKNKDLIHNTLKTFGKPIGYFRLLFNSSPISLLFANYSIINVLRNKLELTKKTLDEVHKTAFECSITSNNAQASFDSKEENLFKAELDEEGLFDVNKKDEYKIRIAKIDSKIKDLKLIREKYKKKLKELEIETKKENIEKSTKEVGENMTVEKEKKVTRTHKKYPIHTDTITGISVVNKNSKTYLLSGSIDGYIQSNMVDHEGNINEMFKLETQYAVYCLKTTINDTLVVADNSNDVKLYKTKHFQEVVETQIFQGHNCSVYCLDVDDRFIISASNDKTVKQWDILTNKCINTIDMAWDIDTQPKLDNKCTPGFGNNNTNLIDIYEGATIGSVKFKGFCMMCGTMDGNIRLYDLRTNQQFRTLKGHTKNVMQIKLVDSNKIISGGIDGKLITWDLRTGIHSEIIEYFYPITDIQIKDKYIYSVGEKSNVQVYNTKSFRKYELTNETLPSPLWCLCFHQDYQCLYQGSYSGCIGYYPL